MFSDIISKNCPDRCLDKGFTSTVVNLNSKSLKITFRVLDYDEVKYKSEFILKLQNKFPSYESKIFV